MMSSTSENTQGDPTGTCGGRESVETASAAGIRPAAMFRELDQRHGDGLTVTLEWNGATGEIQVRCEDRRSPEGSFTYSVDPDDARLAFLHPFALRPSSQELQAPANRGRNC